MSWIETLGQQLGGQTAGGLVGAAMGLIGQKHQDQRQIDQQQRLQGMEIAGSKALTDYQSQKQYEMQMKMWNETNYAAQIEQLKKAGLNPGLIYGEGGGGGATTGGTLPSGKVSGATAQQSVPNPAMQQGMGITPITSAQIQLMKAQARNLDADTANKPATGENIQAGTGKTKAETESITQGIQNQKAQQALTQAQTKVTELQGTLLQGTLAQAIEKFKAETSTAIQQARIAMNEADISDETVKDKIKILKAQAIGAVLDNMLARKDLKIKDEQIKAIKESVTNMNSLRQLKWQQEERNALHQTLTKEGVDGDTGSIIENVINGIINLW